MNDPAMPIPQPEIPPWSELCNEQSSGNSSLRQDGKRDEASIPHSNHSGNGTPGNGYNGNWQTINEGQKELSQYRSDRYCQDVPDSTSSGLERTEPARSICPAGLLTKRNIVPDSHECDSSGTEISGWGQTFEGEIENDSRGNRGKSYGVRSVKPRLGRMADGLSYWMDEPDGIPRVATGIKDRNNRLKGLGNAVVPYQIYPIYKAIVEIETKQRAPESLI